MIGTFFIFYILGCSTETKIPTTKEPTEKELLEQRKRKEKRKLKFIAEDVSCLRGQLFSPIPFLEHQSTEDFRTFVKTEIETEFGTPKGKNFSFTLKGLRLISTNFDLKQSYIDMLAEQAAAYYDPNTDGFYIVQQMKGVMLDATIAHELQHALQDQHTNLLKQYTMVNKINYDY